MRGARTPRRPLVDRIAQQRLRALNDADGRFVTVCAAAERQDRLADVRLHDDFIVDVVVRDCVHRAIQLRVLSLDDPARHGVLVGR